MIKETKYTSNGLSVPIHCQKYKRPISYRSSTRLIHYFNKEMIDKAHENGIRCNVFWSDDPEETKKFIDMGIDTILTNDYNIISGCVER